MPCHVVLAIRDNSYLAMIRLTLRRRDHARGAMSPRFVSAAIAFVIALQSLAAQGGDVVYVDAAGSLCAADTATYVRHYRRLDDSLVHIEDFSRSGRLRSTGSMTDPTGGRRVGAFRFYHATGGLECEAFYVDGKLQGDIAWWYPTGRLRGRGQYQADTAVGLFSNWYPDGNLKDETTLRAGRRHGAATTWHPGGAVKSRGVYRDDREWGRWLWFYEDRALEGYSDHDSATGDATRIWLDRSGRVSGRERLVRGRIVDAEYFLDSGIDRCFDSTAYGPPLPVGVAHPNELLAYFQAKADSLHPIVDDTRSATVGVWVVVEPDGTLAQAIVHESTDPALDAAALDVVRRTRWRPGVRHHEPSQISASVPVRFRPHTPAPR